MAGLNHDFLLLSCEEHPIEQWQRCYNNPAAIKIHNDVLEYMSDTLKWIPTYNPATKQPHNGLCWSGPTIIRESVAELAANLFRLWVELFSRGPEELLLTGQFGWQVENDPDKDGFERVVPNTAEYERLVLSRDPLIAKLRTLVSYAVHVHQGNGTHYVLHLGI